MKMDSTPRPKKKQYGAVTAFPRLGMGMKGEKAIPEKNQPAFA